MSEQRTENFQRNNLLEQLLFGLNGDLKASEQLLMGDYTSISMNKPIILIMGPLRSGTTLFTQWLANTGMVAYPTNLLSRFYQAPIIGAKIQLLLTDPRYNFRDELGEFAQQAAYQSENGKTKGVLAPNEFWYFWRRFLSEPSRDVWTDEELKLSMDVQSMKAELIGMMDVLQKPFVAKGMLFNYNIPFLDSILDKVIFVHIQRDVAANTESVLQARERQLGSKEAWYSFKIPEYDVLKNLSPEEQVVGQIQSINRAVLGGLKNISQERKLTVQYEDFCKNPEIFFVQLQRRICQQGYDVEQLYQGEKCFEIPRRMPSGKVLKACQKWSDKPYA